ncbi:MAG TPA: hypothetical protein VFV99_33525 [Kofleriaceae bacterium]|nr:hypothetical protein [Kofleriaceae bacterium]
MRAVIALLLLTGTAYAGNNEISYTSTNRALRSDSANALTGDSLFGGGLAYGRRINTLAGLEMWVNGTFGWGTASGEMFQTMTTQLSTLWLTAGAQLRYHLTERRFVASGRLDVGSARASLAIHDDMGHTASDHGWGAISSAALGIDCYAFAGQRYALSFRAELSAVATSSIPLTATPDATSDDTLHLEMTAASLGGLNLSGPAFSVSAVFQF